MARSFHSVLCLAVLAGSLGAQRPSITLDASIGARAGARRAAVGAWSPILQLADRVHLGFGLRASAYGGDPTNYTNRGAVRGSLASGVAVDPAVYGLNGAVFGELGITGWVAVGANLDVLGVATGPTRTTGALVEHPQSFSYFRYGSADHGALNSEFFVSLRVVRRFWVRAGISHYVTNYRVIDTTTAGMPSSRYQAFETVPFVAVQVRP